MEGLGSNEDMTEPIEVLHFVMTNTLKLSTTKEDIALTLKWIPLGKHRNLSFPVFMLALANFNLARRHRLLLTSELLQTFQNISHRNSQT